MDEINLGLLVSPVEAQAFGISAGDKTLFKPSHSTGNSLIRRDGVHTIVITQVVNCQDGFEVRMST